MTQTEKNDAKLTKLEISMRKLQKELTVAMQNNELPTRY